MASTDDALETYTHIPLQIDPQSKQLSVSSSDRSLQEAINSLNDLHKLMKSLETTNNVPPPPIPVNPKRSAQIQKLRDSAAASSRKGQHADAVRLLSVAIDMATARPNWEPMGLAREELGLTYLARAAENLELRRWIDGWKDAECSTECRRGPGNGPNGERIPGNPKAFVLGGRCLLEMSRYSEAVQWLEKAIEVEGKEGDDGRELVRLLTEAKKNDNIPATRN